MQSLPNAMLIKVHNFTKFSLYSSITEEHHLSDAGLVDVILSVEGLIVSFHVLFSLLAHVGVTGYCTSLLVGPDKSSVFDVVIVVKVHSLKFSICDLKHDLCYQIFKPLATHLVKQESSQRFDYYWCGGNQWTTHQH